MRKPSGASHVHGPLTTKQFGPRTWPAFEELFAAHNGVWGGCWCMFYHTPGGFDEHSYDSNKKAKHSLAIQGRAHGTLVFCGSKPVGWCQFGPIEELPRIDRKKAYSPTAPDAWRITCLFVDRYHRKRGIARAAVAASVDAMRVRGVKNIEAYPVTGNLSSSLLWSGTPELFRRLGFRRVRSLGKSASIYSFGTL